MAGADRARAACRAKNSALPGPLVSLTGPGFQSVAGRGPCLAAVSMAYLARINFIWRCSTDPGFPLDGGRVLRAWSVAYRWPWATHASFSGLCRLRLRLVSERAVAGTDRLFLQNAAVGAVQQGRSGAAGGITVGQVMSRDVAWSTGEITLDRLVQERLPVSGCTTSGQ
jgi:hypothetical protein